MLNIVMRLCLLLKHVVVTIDEQLLEEDLKDLTQLRTVLAFQSLCKVFSLLGFSVEVRDKTSKILFPLSFASLTPSLMFVGFIFLLLILQTKPNISSNDSSDTRKYHVCYKLSCCESRAEFTLIYCGAVLDSSTGVKATSVDAKDFYRYIIFLFYFMKCFNFADKLSCFLSQQEETNSF